LFVIAIALGYARVHSPSTFWPIAGPFDFCVGVYRVTPSCLEQKVAHQRKHKNKEESQCIQISSESQVRETEEKREGEREARERALGGWNARERLLLTELAEVSSGV
jgi:hypothetical protein